MVELWAARRGFHARASALSRTYVYLVGTEVSEGLSPYAWSLPDARAFPTLSVQRPDSSPGPGRPRARARDPRLLGLRPRRRTKERDADPPARRGPLGELGAAACSGARGNGLRPRHGAQPGGHGRRRRAGARAAGARRGHPGDPGTISRRPRARARAHACRGRLPFLLGGRMKLGPPVPRLAPTQPHPAGPLLARAEYLPRDDDPNAPRGKPRGRRPERDRPGRAHIALPPCSAVWTCAYLASRSATASRR